MTQAQRELIRIFKSKPCVDCVSEGRGDGIWDYWMMTVDHLPGYPKTMEMSGGSDKSRGNRTGGMRPYTFFSYEALRKELENCEPVCANHQNDRTRKRIKEKSNLVRYSEDRLQPTLPGFELYD